MAGVGTALLVFHLFAAYGAVLLVATARRTRPDLPTTLAVLAVFTIVFGYPSYRGVDPVAGRGRGRRVSRRRHCEPPGDRCGDEDGRHDNDHRRTGHG
jgi:hypothetical protein